MLKQAVLAYLKLLVQQLASSQSGRQCWNLLGLSDNRKKMLSYRRETALQGAL